MSGSEVVCSHWETVSKLPHPQSGTITSSSLSLLTDPDGQPTKGVRPFGALGVRDERSWLARPQLWSLSSIKVKLWVPLPGASGEADLQSLNFCGGVAEL